MSKSIRIRTTPNGDDKFLKVNLEQDFDFVEILSLKISQKELYTKFCADYGVIVGRVTVNNGFGVPNAKVSVFVPISDDDKLDPETYGEYPFETISDNDTDGTRYNLLSRNNDTDNECFTAVGSFPNKREFIDNDDMLDVYCKYYKFTTTTNDAGDYMIFGVPAGAHIMYAEADMSDIGNISQKPYDYIRQGSTADNFDSTTKFKKEDNLDAMNHIINRSPFGVDVQPFWGDEDMCNVMITRRDVDLKTRVTPHAIFIGSIFGDNEESSINTTCKPRNELGVLDGQTAGSGKIEMIRQTISGSIERFDVKGGQLIDKDGTWAYQVPMNLDYRITDEYGDLVPSDDPNKGLPTKAKVRFRIGMDVTGGEGKLRTRGKYLIPHNPEVLTDVDYEFGSQTRPASLATLSWNTIYTVKNHIERYEHTDKPSSTQSRAFIGIKDVDSARGKYTPFPFDRLFIASNALFNFICGLVIILAGIITLINMTIISIINDIIGIINDFITLFGGDGIAYVPCIKLACQDNDYAPGCMNGRPGCEAAGGPPVGSTICVGSTTENCCTCTDILCDAGYTHCVALSLIEDLNLLKFDFYNDWVNGTLYAPLFKYSKKKTGNGREKFCEWSCGGYTGGVYNEDPANTSGYDNDCYDDTYILDSCVGHDGCNAHQAGSNRTNEGVIHKNDDTLYYAPYSRNLGRSLLATDIVSLGSSVKCHYDAVPMVQQLFIDTTYNMLPLLAETTLNGNNLTIVTNGIDSPSRHMVDSVFVDVNCVNTQARSQQCGNLRRQCELGVGLDDATQNPNGSWVEPDAHLRNNDIDVRFNRNVFAWLNDETLRTLHPNPIDVDCEWDGDPDCGSQMGTDDYNIFRYGNPNFFGTPQHLTTNNKTKASFYFYFGLNAASTALSKLRERYFAPCPVIADDNFVVVGNVTHDSGNSDGEIDVTVIGGTGPYTYIWTYPNGDVFTLNPTLLDPNAGDISSLDGGLYTLTVVDSAGLSTTTTFVVNSPLQLTCTATATANVTIVGGLEQDDGIIQVTVNGGISDYTITAVNTVAPFNTPPDIVTSVPVNLFTNLPAGVYDIVVTDDNGETCPSTGANTVTVGLPAPVDMVINSSYIGSGDTQDPLSYSATTNAGSPTCHDIENGVVSIQPLGGTPPYTVTVTNPSMQPSGLPFNSTDFVNTGLGYGTFTVDVTDSDGSTAQSTITLVNPPVYSPSIVSSQDPQSTGASDGFIEIDAGGGVGPYDIYITGQNPVFNEDLPYLWENLPAGVYDYYVIDITGCQSTTGQIELIDP